MNDVAPFADAAWEPPGPLPRGSIYVSEAGRAACLAFYDKVLNRLPFPVRTLVVPTRYGRTHLSIAGNPAAPPLVVLPGMSIGGPMMLEFFEQHAADRLLIAPDLIGHPGRSEDRVHPSRDHGHGLWLADILDALGLERADMAVSSFGSSFALDLASVAPGRVGKLALLVPAGLTPRLPYVTFYFPFFLSWLIYRYLPVRSALPVISRPLARELTEDNFDYLDLVIRHTTYFRHRPAGPFRPEDLRDYRTPVFLVTAGRDRLFPRKPTRENTYATLNIAEEIFLAESAHMPSEADMVEVHRRLAQYLAG